MNSPASRASIDRHGARTSRSSRRPRTPHRHATRRHRSRTPRQELRLEPRDAARPLPTAAHSGASAQDAAWTQPPAGTDPFPGSHLHYRRLIKDLTDSPPAITERDALQEWLRAAPSAPIAQDAELQEVIEALIQKKISVRGLFACTQAYLDAALADVVPGPALMCAHEASCTAWRIYQESLESGASGPRQNSSPTEHETHLDIAPQVGIEVARALARLGPRTPYLADRNTHPSLQGAEGHFNLSGFLNEPIQVLPKAIDSKWFAPLDRIYLLKREADAPQNRGQPHIASSNIGAWPPLWWGSRLNSEAKRKFLAAREKNPAHSLATLLGYSATFWLSHCAAGLVQFEACFAHILLLVRLNEERGLQFAARYSDHVLENIRTAIREGREIDISSYIAYEDFSLTQEILTEIPSARVPHRDDRGAPQPGKGKGKSHDPSRASPPGSGGRQLSTATNSSRPETRKQVCFDHDPLHAKTCSAGVSCTREHLDTRDPASADRWRRAHDAFKRRETQRAQAAARH